MGVAELVDAFDTDPDGPDEAMLRAELVDGGFVIPSDTSVATGVLQVDPVDAVTGAIRKFYLFGDGVFAYDAADNSTAHDGVTCLVLIGGYRYKVLGDIRVKAVEAVGIDAEPTPSEYGQAWIDLTGVVGSSNQIIIHTSRGWVAIDPDYGPPIYVKTATDGYPAKSYVHWDDDDGWVSGVGSVAVLDASVPLSALAAWGLGPVRVSNQTTYAPPGSRQTGATPTMPIGGAQNNINDNSDSTFATTNAIGNKSGATVADRIVARLALASATDLIAIEVRSIDGTTTSTSNAMGLYYSTDNGSTWTQAGAGFTLATTAQNVMRTGSFPGVTDIAVVTEAKNWSSNTHSLYGLNAFSAEIVASVGSAFIIAATAIGVLAGNEGKVAICEAENTLTIYTPQTGNVVFDINLNLPLRYNGSAWESAGGSLVGFNIIVTNDTLNSSGASGLAYTYSDGSPPSKSNGYRQDDAGITATPKKANATQRFRYQFRATETGARVVALVRGNESTAIFWVFLAAMTSGQNYIVDLYDFSAPKASDTWRVIIVAEGATNYPSMVGHRTFTREEFA